jgi:multidrug efflux pump subunit AcrA (membrane-fusion protein)
VKIRITGSDPALKIGMNARLNIVRQEKSDIYAVPYDALVDAGGSGSFVYAAVQDGKSWKAKKIPVQTGLENDVSVEISASSLQDGMRIVGNPDSLTDGSTLVFAQGG